MIGKKGGLMYASYDRQEKSIDSYNFVVFNSFWEELPVYNLRDGFKTRWKYICI